MSFYGMDGTEKSFYRNDYKPWHDATMPSTFDEMKNVAVKIATEVNGLFVRIDLYSISEHIYFSKIIFFSCNGFIPFEPATADEQVGKLLYLQIGDGACR